MLTDEQRAEQKRRWYEARDARRRIRYSEDPEYRDQRRAASREDFRKRNNVDPSDFRDCRKNYDHLDDFGKLRVIAIGDELEEHLTFNVAEVAQALGNYNKTIIRRWISKDMMPPPVLMATDVTGSFGRETGTSEVQVYLEDEVKAMIEVLGPHQSQYRYYRADHRDTVDLLYDAIGVVRNELGIV